MREWAAQIAKHHPEDDSLEEWLVTWDCNGDAVRDRQDFLSGVRTRLGMTAPVDELLQRWPYEFGSHYRLDDATRTALRRTRRRGIPVVIVTNGVTAHQEAKLDAIGARDVVDGWVISEQVGVRKPDRRIFERAAELVGKTLDGSWMLGDNPTADIGGAANAGMKSAWVNRYHRTWVGEEDPPPTFEHPAPAIEYAASAMSATAAGPAPEGAIPPVQVSPADVDDEDVLELLAVAIGGGGDRADRIVEQYRRDPALVLLRASIGGALVGVVGYTVEDPDVVVLHIATREDSSRSGIGRQMLQAVGDAIPKHFRLVAETDSDAVGFYIANGFLAESLGEKYPGVERFHVHTLASRLPPRN
jgi:putative hydrolase of the HAD superfamily